MNNIFSRLRDFVGLNERVEYEYEYDETEAEETYPQNRPAATNTNNNNDEEERQNRRRLRERALGAVPTPAPNVIANEVGMRANQMNNVIGMPGVANSISEVVVMEPRSFEEMPQAIQALRERKSVVLNLTMMDPDQAQRAVDFIAGGTFALDGHQERIGESIFLFTPSCVQVSTQSGVVHEVMQAPVRPATRPAPTPNWQSEPGRIAQ